MTLWEARAKFVFVVERRRAILKERDGRYLIRTGFPTSAICFIYVSRVFSFDGVRYCWPWAFSSESTVGVRELFPHQRSSLASIRGTDSHADFA